MPDCGIFFRNHKARILEDVYCLENLLSKKWFFCWKDCLSNRKMKISQNTLNVTILRKKRPYFKMK